jgi:hypothetical protein
VFTEVKDSMKISREEIFGPVQCISKWSKMDEVRDSSVEAGGLGLRARGLGGCRDQTRMSTGVGPVQCTSRGARWTRWGLVASGLPC